MDLGSPRGSMVNPLFDTTDLPCPLCPKFTLKILRCILPIATSWKHSGPECCTWDVQCVRVVQCPVWESWLLACSLVPLSSKDAVLSCHTPRGKHASVQLVCKSMPARENASQIVKDVPGEREAGFSLRGGSPKEMLDGTAVFYIGSLSSCRPRPQCTFH